MKGNEKLFRNRFMVFVLTCSLLAGTFAFSGERFLHLRCKNYTDLPDDFQC